MIPNQWYPICESRNVRAGRPMGLTRLGERLVLWRGSDGRLCCARDVCPHRAARLSLGRIREGCLECPYHGLRFDSAGRCVLIPANGKDSPVQRGFDLDLHEIREVHGLVWLWYGERGAATAEVPWFDEAPGLGGNAITVAREYPFSYLRVMENMTDGHHVPFVHRRSLPGAGTRIVDVTEQVGRDWFSVGMTLRNERPDRWLRRDYRFVSTLRLPTLATIEVVPGVRFVASATPIDGDRTWLWARYRQEWLPRWLGGRALSRLLALYDLTVIFSWQDARMLRNQQLDDPADISRYRLFEADRGVALYFGMRKRAILEAERQHEELSSPRAAAG